LGRGVFPQSRNMIELAGIDLEQGATAVGVSQNIICGGSDIIFEMEVDVVCPFDHVYKFAFCPYLFDRGGDRHAKSGGIILAGQRSHAVTFELGETGRRQHDIKREIDKLELAKRKIVELQSLKSGLHQLALPARLQRLDLGQALPV